MQEYKKLLFQVS